MKVYISIDVEGLPGISSISQLTPRSPLFSDSRDVMTRIVTSIVEVLDSVEDIEEFIVADSHGYMCNILPLRLPISSKLRLVQGYPRPISMVIEAENCDIAMFIGYHAAAGTISGFLDHTYSGATFHRIYLNNALASEYLLNAVLLGEKGVPIALVAGDEALRREVELYTPWTIFVPMKRGLSRYSAIYKHIDEVIKDLKIAIDKALENYRKGILKPLTMERPYRLTIELKNSGLVDMLYRVKGVERLDGYTIRYTCNSMEECFAFIEIVALMNAGLSRILEVLRG